jgi:hypothetical protein
MKKLLLIYFITCAGFLACDGDSSSNPPGPVEPIAIVSPSGGATLQDPINIVAAAGTGYAFTVVDFYIDDSQAGIDSVYPYTYFWNIFEYDATDLHTIYAVGHTAEDSTYQSDAVTVALDFEQGFSFAGTYQPGSQNALGVVNYYNVLFVTLGDAGLEMLDIRERTAPQFLSRFDTPGQALRADVRFPRVFIADRSEGVRAADFSDPDTLMGIVVYTSQSLAVDVALSANYIYVAENDGLVILDYDTDDAFDFLGRLAITNDQVNYVVTRNDTAFVLGDNSFYIVDCRQPTAPDLVATYDNLNLAAAVAVTDTFVFIANGTDGVIALSIEDPTRIRFLARFNPGQNMSAVDAGDGVLFAGARAGTVYALSYATAGSLIEIDSFSASNQLEEIDYESNYVYVAAHTNVDILRFVR